MLDDRDNNIDTDKLSADVRAHIERELKGYAHNIHDEISGGISGVIIQLENIKRTLARVGDEKTVSDINLVILSATETLEASRRIANKLRPSLLDHFGLAAAIDQMLKDFQIRYGVNTSLVIEPNALISKNDKQKLSERQCLEVFRIAQEVLNNIIKHANAHHVDCEINGELEHVIFTFKDDGCGIGWDAVQGVGIGGIKIRALSAHGSVSITPLCPCGTMVKLKVKVLNNDAHRQEG
ncbi:MAG: hypothetical protein CTY35_00585 [Methylotenera sp.]|nr:MAG: hypothetical protein CTY38_00580 [Methylotenera sp.]PPD02212.1 MAG: hypothetical protein CTY35_00585 [Methylotenera sp.]